MIIIDVGIRLPLIHMLAQVFVGESASETQRTFEIEKFFAAPFAVKKYTM
jgi:hypothetical protein